MQKINDMDDRARLMAGVRLEETKRELESATKAVKEWLDRRDKSDAIGRHKTQLGAVRSVLMGAAGELQSNLKDVDPTRLSVAEVYDQCREYDQAVVWLRRLWEYLREKFDQRDERQGGTDEKSKDVARLLRSADEVVWSCYHSVLTEAAARNGSVKHGPAPLTYIEPEYSPATVQLDKPLPFDLMLKADLEFMDDFLESLPIPVLRLPPWCVGAPWWLIYIGHEVGHHVQHKLDLVGHFHKGLSAAALRAGLQKDDAKRWGEWGEEIFADIFSVLMMGQWAVRAMAEAEMSTPEKMVKQKDTYPAPIIRLALMERVARGLLLDTSEAVLGLQFEAVAKTDPKTELDYKVIDEVVKFVREELPGDLGTLENLCGFDRSIFQPDASIEMLSRLIPDGAALSDDESRTRVEAAREVAAASLCAWAGLAAKAEGDEREAARQKLSRQTVETLLTSGPRQTRGEELPDGEVPGGGKNLAAKLLRAARGTGRK